MKMNIDNLINSSKNINIMIVDECKETVSYLINLLEEFFGKFSITRGKCHDYLGMKIKICEDSKVEIDMIESIQQIFDDFSEPLLGQVTSPATSELYTQEEDESRERSAGS